MEAANRVDGNELRHRRRRISIRSFLLGGEIRVDCLVQLLLARWLRKEVLNIRMSKLVSLAARGALAKNSSAASRQVSDLATARAVIQRPTPFLPTNSNEVGSFP